MSENTERDTHFAGFAKLLWQELLYVQGGYIDAEDFSFHGQNHYPEHEKIIAQRAYDLLIHDRMNTGTSDLQTADSRIEAEEYVNHVPDMQKWSTDG